MSASHALGNYSSSSRNRSALPGGPSYTTSIETVGDKSGEGVYLRSSSLASPGYPMLSLLVGHLKGIKQS